MSRDENPRADSHRNLVRRILDNPRLPACIARLEAPALDRLIRYVGKEDAQELIAHATAAQVRALVEVDAWHNDRPGGEERFEPGTFLEWLALFEDMGPKFLAEKVGELGSELFALALDRYAVVVDITTVGVMGDFENFADFGVLPKDEDEWPPIRALLTEIWNEDPDFVEAALAHCCQRRSLLAEKTHIVANDTLERDIAGDRDDRRRAEGYVTPLSASVFLGEAKGTPIGELLISVAYDPATAIQLRAMRARMGRHSADAAVPGAGSARDGGTTPADAADAGDAGLRELGELMAEAVSGSPAAKSIEGPRKKEETLLRRLLRRLGETDSEASEARMSETVYLANILMAGTSIQGARFTETEALKCVYATCNLGIVYCLEEEPFVTEQAMLASFLESEPGMIKAFKLGYHLIGRLPYKAIVAVVRELTTTRAQRRLKRHQWLHRQIAQGLDLDDLREGVRAEHLEKAKDVLDLLEALYDPIMCEQLRVICDPVPCFPKSLEPSAGSRLTVDRARRYIENPRDLRVLLEFLERLG